MTPEDKARAVVNELRGFVVGDRVLAQWIGQRGSQEGIVVKIGDGASDVYGIRFPHDSAIYWFGPEGLLHAD